MKTKLNALLNERYRPSTLDEYIFQDADVERKMRRWVEQGTIPNVLLVGHAGTGKSSAAWVLINELGIDHNDVMVVNGSTQGIAYIRDVVEPWIMKASMSAYKIVLMEECLQEDEKVRIGTVDDWTAVRIGDLLKGETYPVVSINMDTGVLENDTGWVISDKEDDVYEIELEDGRTIQVTADHPMLVLQNGVIIEKTINEGLSENDVIVVC